MKRDDEFTEWLARRRAANKAVAVSEPRRKRSFPVAVIPWIVSGLIVAALIGGSYIVFRPSPPKPVSCADLVQGIAMARYNGDYTVAVTLANDYESQCVVSRG